MIHEKSQKLINAAVMSSLFPKVSKNYLYVEQNGHYKADVRITTGDKYVKVVSETKDGIVSYYRKNPYPNEFWINVKGGSKTYIYGDITKVYVESVKVGASTIVKFDYLPNLIDVELLEMKLGANLDFSKNLELQKLKLNAVYYIGGLFAGYDLVQNTKLTYLSIINSPIQLYTKDKLKLPNSLEEVTLRYIFSGDVSDFVLDFSDFNRLQTLIIDGDLTKLNLNNTISLTTLDIGSPEKLTELHCNRSNINVSSLDLSKFVGLTKFYCNYNAVKELDLSKNTSLKEIKCHNCVSLRTLKLPENNTTLASIDASNCELKTLDVYDCVGLKKLQCHKNLLTSLNVGKNINLQELNCSSNQLTQLDCGALDKLQKIECTDNPLESLDIMKSAAIQTLIVATSALIANKLAAIHCSGTSAAAYSSLNDQFDYLANTGTLTVDDTETSATLRATAEAKGWTVTIETIN